MFGLRVVCMLNSCACLLIHSKFFTMKNTLKTHRFALLLLLALFATACEKDTDTLPRASSLNGLDQTTASAEVAISVAGKQAPPPLDFTFIVSDCFCGVVTIDVQTPMEEVNYAYLWEIDGKAAGHAYRKICICGELVTLRLTRLSDGACVGKSMALPACREREEEEE